LITVGFKTDKGKRRKDNEDSIFVIPDKKIFIVADGVGGQNSGELASRMTVGYMAQFVCLNPIEEAKTGTDLKNYFKELFSGANSLVHEKAVSEPGNFGMATTTVLCYIRDNTAYFVNVGDSRAYLIRDGKYYQITEDHSFVQTMIREGHITKEEALQRVDRNMITRAIGGDTEVHPDFFTLDLFPKDTIILCTDGLHGEVPDERIAAMATTTNTMHDLAIKLIDSANEAGGKDNISVVCIRIQ
jgi:protein phosphatase